MKKLSLIAIITLAVSITAGAQGVEDALRLSEQFYVGSARTMAMGNAFTALGGDLGAVGINPASTALYNCCEFAITGGWSANKTNSVFYGTDDSYAQKASTSKFNVPNICAVFSIPTGKDYGLVSYSVGFGLAKTSNFNSRISYGGDDANTSLLGNIATNLDGFNNGQLLASNIFAGDDNYCTAQEVLAWQSYLVNPLNGSANQYIGATENNLDGFIGVDNYLKKSWDMTTSGGISDMQFNFGMNFNDRLYLGVNANIKLVEYNRHISYQEMAYDGDNYSSGFQAMDYDQWLKTSGAGVNLQLGAIYVPFNFLRLGVSYTTPTIYDVTDTWDEAMRSTFSGKNPDCKSSEVWLSDLYADENDTSYGDLRYDYSLKAPSRLSLGAAFVFGKSGLLSFDWESVNYGKMRFLNDANQSEFNGINKEISETCLKGYILRMGAESNLSKNYSLRGGYTGYFYGADAIGYQYFSLGLGKRISENSSIDVAYRTSLRDKFEMSPYDDYAYNESGQPQCVAPVADISSRYGDLMFTYRVKF